MTRSPTQAGLARWGTQDRSLPSILDVTNTTFSINIIREAEAAAAAERALENECDDFGCDDHAYAPECDTFEVDVDGAPLVAPWTPGNCVAVRA